MEYERQKVEKEKKLVEKEKLKNAALVAEVHKERAKSKKQLSKAEYDAL